MRVAWLLAALTVSALGWAACTSFGGDGPADTTDGGDAETDGFTASPDVGIVDGGGPAVDAHVPVDGALIDDSFENGGTCDLWKPGNGATAFPVAGGHSGARSCVVCANGNAGFIQKGAGLRDGGTYQALAFVRAPEQDAASNIDLEIRAYAPDGGPSGIGGGLRKPAAQWEVAQAVADVAGTSDIMLIIYIDGTSGCALIDDVSLTGE